MILAGRPDPMSNLSIVSLFYGSSVFCRAGKKAR